MESLPGEHYGVAAACPNSDSPRIGGRGAIRGLQNSEKGCGERFPFSASRVMLLAGSLGLTIGARAAPEWADTDPDCQGIRRRRGRLFRRPAPFKAARPPPTPPSTASSTALKSAWTIRPRPRTRPRSWATSRYLIAHSAWADCPDIACGLTNLATGQKAVPYLVATTQPRATGLSLGLIRPSGGDAYYGMGGVSYNVSPTLQFVGRLHRRQGQLRHTSASLRASDQDPDPQRRLRPAQHRRGRRRGRPQPARLRRQSFLRLSPERREQDGLRHVQQEPRRRDRRRRRAGK